MATKIFINLPVKDLNVSVAFFTQLGFRPNPQFSNEQGACMVVSEIIYVMLLTEPFFQTFTPKAIADARSSAEVILCLSADSRSEVDKLLDKALRAGATEPKKAQDHGFMYGRSFQDPDGHLWEVMFLEPSAVQPEPAAAEASVA